MSTQASSKENKIEVIRALHECSLMLTDAQRTQGTLWVDSWRKYAQVEQNNRVVSRSFVCGPFGESPAFTAIVTHFPEGNIALIEVRHGGKLFLTREWGPSGRPIRDTVGVAANLEFLDIYFPKPPEEENFNRFIAILEEE